MRNSTAPLALAAIAVALSTSFSYAESTVHTVEMLNRGPAGAMVYAPELVEIAVGDTIEFKATDRGHNVDWMVVPEGAEVADIGFNQDGSIIFTVPGIYTYRCTPHVGMGMVGVIVVGDDYANEAAALEERLPPRAKQKIEALIETAKAE